MPEGSGVMLAVLASTPRTAHQPAAGELESVDRLPLILRRVTVGAATYFHQVLAVLYPIGRIGSSHWRG